MHFKTNWGIAPMFLADLDRVRRNTFFHARLIGYAGGIHPTLHMHRNLFHSNMLYDNYETD